jgi:diketogulonate reductase-like aldo/keto reductase
MSPSKFADCEPLCKAEIFIFLKIESGGAMKLKLYISLALLILTCHADNDRMPRIGLGTAGLGHDTASAVQFALDAGYRMFDTAQADEWYNEEMVGQTLKQWTGDSQSLFIVSKIHPRDFGYQRTRQLVQRSVERLGKVDLMLIHFPRCWEGLCEGYPYQ